MSSNAIFNLNAVTPGLVPASPVVRPAATPAQASGEPTPSPAVPGTAAESAATPVPASQLEQAVGELNHYVAGSRTDLQFRVDEEVGRLVVSIVDSESGQVLRQMPSEDALRIARYLESGSLHLLNKQA